MCNFKRSQPCSSHPNKWFGFGEDKQDVLKAETICIEAGGRLISNWNEQLDLCTKNVLSYVSNNQNDVVSGYIGAKYNNNRTLWVWSDGFHEFTPNDTNQAWH